MANLSEIGAVTEIGKEDIIIVSVILGELVRLEQHVVVGARAHVAHGREQRRREPAARARHLARHQLHQQLRTGYGTGGIAFNLFIY